jgi:hypothetical protein
MEVAAVDAARLERDLPEAVTITSYATAGALSDWCTFRSSARTLVSLDHPGDKW